MGDIENKRIEWVDVAKGIAIICVVLGHVLSRTSTSFYENWLLIAIYSFHMPLFFVLSGVVNKSKDFRNFVKNKGKDRLMYFLFFTVLFWIVMLPVVINSDIGLNEGFELATKLFVRSMGQYWFLISLLCAEIIILFISNIKSKALMLLTCVLCIAFNRIMFANDIVFGVGLLAGLLAVPFLLIGKKIKNIIPNKPLVSLMLVVSWISILGLWTVYRGYVISLYDSNTGNVFTFYLFGIWGSISVVCMSNYICKIISPLAHLLKCLGQWSIWIYGLHYIFLDISDWIFKRLAITWGIKKIAFDIIATIVIIICSIISKTVFVRIEKYVRKKLNKIV